MRKINSRLKRRGFRSRVTKITPKRKAMPSFATRVKRVIMRVAEPKIVRHSTDKVNLYHNSFSYALHLNDVNGMPTQGTGDNMRVGDEINVTRYRVRALIGQQADRPNVTFRWFFIEAPKGLSATYANFFIATTNNVMLDDPNEDAVRVLKRGQMRPNQAGLLPVGGDEYTFTKEWSLNYKRKYKFGPAQATTAHNQREVYFIIMAYDAYGTLVTDNIAYIQSLKETHYRDP
nr:MAG: capsid protein [Skomarfal virus 48]